MKKYTYKTTHLYKNRQSIICAKKGPLLYIRLRTLNDALVCLEAQRCLVEVCAKNIFYVLLLDLSKAKGTVSEDFVRWIRYDFFPFLAQQELTDCVIIPSSQQTIHSIISGWHFEYAYHNAFSFTLEFATSYRDAKKLIQHRGVI